MGNAVITIHHPTSLDHGIPYLESGKIVSSTTSTLRLEKKDGTAVGCGGRVVFKKTVGSSQWTYKVTKQTNTNFEIGQEVTVDAGTQAEADAKVAVKFGMSWTEVRESVTLFRSVICDSNTYSELYCYVDYNGKDNGTYHWTRNDLDLKASHRWAEDSEMIIDINTSY